MRHGVALRKLGRTTSHRRAMLRNMVTSLIKHERIQTTVPKAKELRRVADKMVTLGKKDTPASFSQAMAYVQEKPMVHKLFQDIAPRFASRNGGYTRVQRDGFRAGDAAPMAVIEFVDSPFVVQAVAAKSARAQRRADAKAELKEKIKADKAEVIRKAEEQAKEAQAAEEKRKVK